MFFLLTVFASYPAPPTPAPSTLHPTPLFFSPRDRNTVPSRLCGSIFGERRAEFWRSRNTCRVLWFGHHTAPNPPPNPSTAPLFSSSEDCSPDSPTGRPQLGLGGSARLRALFILDLVSAVRNNRCLVYSNTIIFPACCCIESVFSLSFSPSLPPSLSHALLLSQPTNTKTLRFPPKTKLTTSNSDLVK